MSYAAGDCLTSTPAANEVLDVGGSEQGQRGGRERVGTGLGGVCGPPAGPSRLPGLFSSQAVGFVTGRADGADKGGRREPWSPHGISSVPGWEVSACTHVRVCMRVSPGTGGVVGLPQPQGASSADLPAEPPRNRRRCCCPGRTAVAVALVAWRSPGLGVRV